MSCSYAEGLSAYENKSKLGKRETFDHLDTVREKVRTLTEWISKSKHTVVHTGAGISTSAGIPDFRGPRGVWTLEKKGLKPEINVTWDEAVPTITHRAIRKLVEDDQVQFVVTQNIDGLHMRSGINRKHLAEVHGNIEDHMLAFYAQVSDVPCPAKKSNGRACRGKLADFVLDWEDSLPDDDLDLSDAHSCLAQLSIVMGSTLQIVPAGNLPTFCKRYYPEEGRLAIINLQPTKHDKKADLIIHDYVDRVMELLFKELDLKIPEYDPLQDPTKAVQENSTPFIEWTQCHEEARRLKKEADDLDTEYKKKKASKTLPKQDFKEEMPSNKLVKLCKDEESSSSSNGNIINNSPNDQLVHHLQDEEV